VKTQNKEQKHQNTLYRLLYREMCRAMFTRRKICKRISKRFTKYQIISQWKLQRCFKRARNNDEGIS
jgi:hypothetical protein